MTADTSAAAGPEVPAPDDTLLRQALRIAIAEARRKEAASNAAAVRGVAERLFAPARQRGITQQEVLLPGGVKAGLISIKRGAVTTRIDEDQLMLVAIGNDPSDVEDYVRPAALTDPRVLALISEHLPEMVCRRIRPGVHSLYEKEIEENDGRVLDRGGMLTGPGERVRVATITHGEATGEYAYLPGTKGAQLIMEALDAGLISDDGSYAAPAQEAPQDAPGPEEAAAAASQAGETAEPAADSAPRDDTDARYERAMSRSRPRAAAKAPDHPPTGEQQAVLDAHADGLDVVVNAYAGSGKTWLLRQIAGQSGDDVTYIAYNASARKQANATFPANALCHTSHSLAYKPMMPASRRATEKKRRMKSAEIAKVLGIAGPTRISDDRVLAPAQVAAIVMQTIEQFCYSADERIGAQHVPGDLRGVAGPAELAALRQIIPPLAWKAWVGDITRIDGVLPYDPDCYLKSFTLTHPRLPGKRIMLDEAQDTNPCVAAMVLEQLAEYGTPLTMVGDQNQAIYGWRGARDAMRGFSGHPGVTVLSVTQSFRFGQAIADVGQDWLTILGNDRPLRGWPGIDSRLTASMTPDAILCRTNAEGLKQAIAATEAGRKVALKVRGGIAGLKALTRGAADLKAGRPSDHYDLVIFATWGQLQDYAENDPAGEDLRRFVDLVDQYGTDGLMAILNRLSDDDASADLVVSTAHSAKGLEYPRVEIAADFSEPRRDPEDPPGTLPVIPRETAMLAYVAETRAQKELNPGSLSWVKHYLPGGAR